MTQQMNEQAIRVGASFKLSFAGCDILRKAVDSIREPFFGLVLKRRDERI